MTTHRPNVYRDSCTRCNVTGIVNVEPPRVVKGGITVTEEPCDCIKKITPDDMYSRIMNMLLGGQDDNTK